MTLLIRSDNPQPNASGNYISSALKYDSAGCVMRLQLNCVSVILEVELDDSGRVVWPKERLDKQ